MGKERELMLEQFWKWSDLWDRVFTACKLRNDFRALIAHTRNYNPRWNDVA